MPMILANFSEAQINCTMKSNICTEISFSNEISIWKLTRYGVVSTLIKGYLKEKVLLYSSCNVIQINKCTFKYFWLNMKPVHIFRVNFRSRRMKSEALKDCLELKKVLKKIMQLQQTYQMIIIKKLYLNKKCVFKSTVV